MLEREGALVRLAWTDWLGDAQEYCTSTLRKWIALYWLGMPRPSPVTDEVRRLFDAQERHAWSIEELLQSVRTSLGVADYSSVFRAVSQFERQGVVDDASARVNSLTGFKVTSHRVVFGGLCRDCAAG